MSYSKLGFVVSDMNYSVLCLFYSLLQTHDFLAQFESSQSKKFEENKLPNTEEKGNAITKDSFQKMGYMERVKLANENQEAYKALTEN